MEEKKQETYVPENLDVLFEKLENTKKQIIESISNCLNNVEFKNEKNKRTAQNIIDFFAGNISGCVLGVVASENHINTRKAIALTVLSLMTFAQHYDEIQKEIDKFIETLPLKEFAKLSIRDNNLHNEILNDED